MDAFLIIIGLIVGAIVILIILSIGLYIIQNALYIGFRFLPWIVGVIGGIIIWLLGNKMTGNILVVAGFVLGFIWEFHIEKEHCDCIIHKIKKYLGNLEFVNM